MKVTVNKEPAVTEGDVIYEKTTSSGELSNKDAVINDVVELLKEKKLADEKMLFAVRLALDEGLVNAMRHGNKLKAEKEVSTEIFQGPTGFSILIGDQGRGFKPYDVPDPDSEESLYLEHGRGVLIMRAFFDRVEYFRGGTQLYLVKSS